jgi:hypothetical protein
MKYHAMKYGTSESSASNGGGNSGCGCSHLVLGMIGLCILSVLVPKDKEKTAENAPSKLSSNTPKPDSKITKESPKDTSIHQSPTVENRDDTSHSGPPSRPPGLSNDYLPITSTDGCTIWAKFLVKTKTNYMLRRSDGQDFEIPIERLTKPTRDAIESYREKKRAH